MEFPFFWFGALVAGLFLTAVMALFGLALKLLTRATDEVRGSIPHQDGPPLGRVRAHVH